MRFLIDADLGTSIEKMLLELGHQAERAGQVLPPGTSDWNVAIYARQQRQHIITADRGFAGQLRAARVDFPYALLTLRLQPTTAPADAAEMLKQTLQNHVIEDRVHYIIYPDRVRTTALPQQ